MVTVKNGYSLKDVQYINVQESIMYNFADYVKVSMQWLIKRKIVWRPKAVEELTELANLYYESK